MLALPLYRLAVLHWPATITEWVYPDGRIEFSDDHRARNDEGVARSQPLHAARIQLRDGSSRLGYAVALRFAGGATIVPPHGTAWTPERFVEQSGCELGIKLPARATEWLACARVEEVVQPNRMNLPARARLALEHAVPWLASAPRS